MESIEQRRWMRFASPAEFYPLAGRLVPVFIAVAIIAAVIGIGIGFFVAPTDATQGEAYRIIYLHVPVSWMSMFIYLVMGFWAAIGLIMQTRLSFMMMHALAPTGAWMAFLSLWTGAFWGKPTWGTWWVWDARLTSELILLFLYLAIIALSAAIEDKRRGDRACALLTLVGVVNIPIIYFSVIWWNTLHQGASISFSKAPTMATTMLWGIVLMTVGFWAYTVAISLLRCRVEILERETESDWIRPHLRQRAP